MKTLTALLSLVPLENVQASFLLPVFSGGNAAYVHELDSGARVTQFIPIELGGYSVIHEVPSGLACEEGGIGIFAARLKNGKVICDVYGNFFESLSTVDLDQLGSEFFNVDAYLMLRDFPKREKAISLAAGLFANADNGRLWAKMQSSNNESGLFLPGIDPNVQQGILGAARASDDLRHQIEQGIARLKRIEPSRTPIDLPEGRIASMTFLGPRSIRIDSVDPRQQREGGIYYCQLHFTTHMGVKAELENGKSLAFETIVRSNGQMEAKYQLSAPNTLTVQRVDLHDYVVADNDVVRSRTGNSEIS